MSSSIVGSGWRQDENEATVREYFELFVDDIAGRKINKAAVYRKLSQQFGRSQSAYEFKMHNISAVLVRLGWPHLRGLIPLGNYQGSLEIEVARQISQLSDSDISPLKNSETVDTSLAKADLVLHEAPVFLEGGLLEEKNAIVSAAKRDYALIDSQNKHLGLAGELIVFENEKKRLFDMGRKDLSRRVQHVAQEYGDGLGYDILSYGGSGETRHLEVKTTRYSLGTPFGISRNEVKVSRELASSYTLIRLYNYKDFETGKKKSVAAYMVHGDMTSNLRLDPVEYLALPR